MLELFKVDSNGTFYSLAIFKQITMASDKNLDQNQKSKFQELLEILNKEFKNQKVSSFDSNLIS